MIKLGIINVEEFLRTVNACEGAVYMINQMADGPISADSMVFRMTCAGSIVTIKGYLKLMLDIPVPSDYMSIISYYAGDV